MSDSLPIVNFSECHIPIILVVEKSDAVSDCIDELNQCLIEFGKTLAIDPLILGRAEICVISFDSDTRIEIGFRPAVEYTTLTLSAGGGSALNGAIELALDTLNERKQFYRIHGVRWRRPYLFVLTDGKATDTEREAGTISLLRAAIEGKKVFYLPMTVGQNADKQKLREYYPADEASKPVLNANASTFREAFSWCHRPWDLNEPTLITLPLPPHALHIDL